MSGAEARQDVYRKLLYEHEQLRGLLQELKAAVSTDSRSIEEVSAKIRSLRHHLREHFRAEEATGYFSKVVAEAPHTAERVAALEQQHPQLLERVEEMTEAAGRCAADPSDANWEKVASAFQVFSIALLRHETRENELLQEVFVQDIGSHD